MTITGLLAVGLLLTSCLAGNHTNHTANASEGTKKEYSKHDTCKDVEYIHRKLCSDVRTYSPFYVIALTKSARTEQIDNVCYTYFEDNNVFLHIISVVYKNGTSSQAVLYKHDMNENPGLAEVKGDNCTYHDYTLTPICGSTVFTIYRCFLQGACSQIDVGPQEGVDSRVVLAANPKVSDSCVAEITSTLTNTTILDGNEFIMLPQTLGYQCVTSYTKTCINHDQALGQISL